MMQFSSSTAGPIKFLPRRGWSLIEMSLVISLLGMFTVVGTSLLTRLMQLDAALATATSWELNATRLEDQLREDAGHTQHARLAENGIELRTVAGQTIQYHVDGALVRRELSGDGRAARDLFTFEDAEIELSVVAGRIEVVVRALHSLEMRDQAALLKTAANSSIKILIPVGRLLRFDAVHDQDGGTS